MTWNLWWRFGPWERRREAILEVLRTERPDVCGLQEVWERPGENLAEWLAAELGLHWAWAPGEVLPHWREKIGDDPFGVGNAVLSRWPIAETAVLRLPTANGPAEVRTALYALLEGDPERVPFFTTHLTSAPGGSGVRCTQVRALAEFVAQQRGDLPFPPVVTGDFNAEPDSDEMRLFGGSATAPVVPGQVLVDAWRYAEPGQPWATWDGRNPYVADVGSYSARIDYVHVGLPGRPGLGQVRSVRRTGDGPVAGVWPSDHAAVLVELKPLTGV